MLSLLATSLAAPVPAVPDEKSLGDGHLLGAMMLGAVGDKEGAIDMLHHEAHELIDEMHDSKPERQENDHHDYHDDHYHDHYHSNYGSTHQDSNEYYHAHGGRSLGAEEAENKESDTDARPVEAPAEKRSNYHVHYHAPSSGSYYGGVDSFGPPDATSCRGYDCSVQGQFCPPDAPGGTDIGSLLSGDQGFTCCYGQWRQGGRQSCDSYVSDRNSGNGLVYEEITEEWTTGGAGSFDHSHYGQPVYEEWSGSSSYGHHHDDDDDDDSYDEGHHHGGRWLSQADGAASVSSAARDGENADSKADSADTDSAEPSEKNII